MTDISVALNQWLDSRTEANRLALLDATDGQFLTGPVARLIFALRCEDSGGGILSSEEWEDMVTDVENLTKNGMN